MIESVRTYVRKHSLLKPGDRVAVAVSGGADSVALLRVLLELRQELGAVLSVAHFHHGIRGAEADADQQFVVELAEKFDLELHLGAGDAPTHSLATKDSLETSARQLRHAWFEQLVSEGKIEKIATAHTRDDQAETVLMRLLRGTGTLGLAGIFPVHEAKHLVRPFLEISRSEIERYLRSNGQTWREDSTNRDPSHTRNRIRHELLPLLERTYNPAVRENLSDLAEISRLEAEYWEKELKSLMPRLVRPGKPSRSGRRSSGDAEHTLSLDLAAFGSVPPALQKHVLRKVGESLGVSLEFKHIEQLTNMAMESSTKRLTLPDGITAVRSFRELQFTNLSPMLAANYQYPLPVPGEVIIPELEITLRVTVVPSRALKGSGYNPTSLLDRSRLAPHLTVRNWRAGDRFLPAKAGSARKLKEWLQPARIGQQLSAEQRRAWPVIESEGRIVWVRGLGTPAEFAPGAGDAVLIEELETTSARTEL